MIYNWQTGEETQEGYCLYAHINQINYKVYIGISKDVKQRWASKGKNYKSCPKIFNAFKKYGWNNFTHVILFDGMTKEEALQKEEMWVKVAKLAGISYNITDGGEGGNGIKKTPEQKQKISEWLTGRPCSDETKRKISNSHKALHNLDKRIFCFNPQTMEIIAEYSSIREAEKSTGIKHENISRAAKGKANTAGGYIWNYTPKLCENDNRRINYLKQEKIRKVYCYDLDGTLQHVYNSAREAAEAIGGKSGPIGECCSKNRLQYKEFIWRRQEETFSKEYLQDIKRRSRK